MRKRNWLVVMLLVVFTLTLVAGCGQENGGEEANGDTDTGKTYPLTLTDAAGREVTLAAKPERIVSIMPSLTEILFALDAGERVVGVTTYCDYPAAAKEKEVIGDLYNLNPESILALQPDLVLVGKSETLQQTFDFLEQAGTPYFVVDPQTLDEIEESIVTVAKLIDNQAAGEALVTQLKADRLALETKVAEIPAEERAKVFVLLDTNVLYTVGEGTFLSEMITTAGGNNLASEIDDAYFQVSEEAFFELDPEVIICTFPMRDEVLARETWQDLSAIKSGKVYDVDANSVSRPGPRYVQGLELLYEVFAK
ncbi:MAG TPA: cobalamin-binding protein [Oscillospiraceae bacterium]|nr:cobalamin-binding protein [Oscillospiraceae bacterium]